MKHRCFLPWVLVMMCSLRSFAQSTDLITIKADGTASVESSVEAAREIQSEVIAENVRSQVLSIIGEKRYNKFKTMIESRIVKQSAKFIPIVNPGVPVHQADGEWKMSVEFKLSQGSLKKMVQAAGFLNEDEGPTSIVPMVVFTDRDRNASVRWWQGVAKDEAHKLASDVAGIFYDKFQIELSRQNFHLIKPMGLEFSPIPEAFQPEHPSAQDLSFIGDFYQSPMVMTGQVSFKKSKDGGVALGSVQVQVVQVSVQSAGGTQRTVAEVSKQFVSDAGSYETQLRNLCALEFPELAKDLSTQVLEAWQRGVMSGKLLRLSVHGVLTPKQLSGLRSELLQNVQEIKTIKERMFSSSGSVGEFDFDVDVSGDNLDETIEHLKKIRLASFDAQVVAQGTSSRHVEMKVKAR